MKKSELQQMIREEIINLNENQKYDTHIYASSNKINKLSDKEYKLMDKWQMSHKIKAKTFVEDYEIWYNSSDSDVVKIMNKIKTK